MSLKTFIQESIKTKIFNIQSGIEKLSSFVCLQYFALSAFHKTFARAKYFEISLVIA